MSIVEQTNAEFGVILAKNYLLVYDSNCFRVKNWTSELKSFVLKVISLVILIIGNDQKEK